MQINDATRRLGIGRRKDLITDSHYKALGFESVDEVNKAVLAAPLQVYELGLDRLKSYQPSQDPNALLIPSPNTIYPVTVGGQPRSSVTVVHKDTGYTPASFGNAPMGRGLASYRGDGPGVFAVHVPLLGMYFLGSRAADRLVLTPVISSDRVPLRVGVAVPAEEVLKAIAPIVREYNGLPL